MTNHAVEYELQLTPGDKELKSVSNAAGLLLTARQKVKWFEDKLKVAKAELYQLETEELPVAMEACGLSEFTTSDGTRIVVENKVSGSIPEANRPEAFQWLRDHGHGGLIKNEFKLELGKGQDELAHQVRTQLEALGLAVEVKESVNHQTLGAWARELLKQGKLDAPLSLLGIFVGKRATVK
jgi:hypothetical protein